MAQPAISFGIIVLNGEPFTRYCLRSLYPYAHQIIVVEGAAPAARSIADERGHSSDGTLEVLREFQEREDPERKVTVVTAEDEGHPDGFWPGEKHQQSQAYARRATGTHLWQVDIDEFYRSQDIERVLDMLEREEGISAVSFHQLQFWGGFDQFVDGWYLRQGGEEFHRLFRWADGFRYSTHRPPTVLDHAGRDLRSLKWVRGAELRRKGIVLYHYSLVFPKQVVEKCRYYSEADWAQRSKANQWAHEVFTKLHRPFRVHNVYTHPSWLEPFSGEHPHQIQQMRHDLAAGKLKVSLRPQEDIHRKMRSFRYRLGRAALKGIGRLSGYRAPGPRWANVLTGLVENPFGWFQGR